MRRLGLLVLIAAFGALAVPAARADTIARTHDTVTIAAHSDSVSSAVPIAENDSAFMIERVHALASSSGPARDHAPRDSVPLELVGVAVLATARAGGRKNAVVAPVPTKLSKEQQEAADAEKAKVAAARAPTADPKESANVAATGKHDETVDGGRYIGTDGVARNANGDVLKEKK